MPHVDRDFSLASRAEVPKNASDGSLPLSQELISEVVESDVIVLATPMHNLTVPSSLKAWIDHVVRPNLTFRYSGRKMIGLLPDRPVFVVLSSSESSENRDDDDFLKPYLRTMFAAIGISSVEFFGLDSHASSMPPMISPTEALSILARSRSAITHEAIHALWSQLC
jgi:FMN-dependent NADH-azoreductase